MQSVKRKIESIPKEELDEMLKEAFNHLNHGRHRLALNLAQKVFEHRQNDFRVAICLAWSFLENSEPSAALEYADLAVKLSNDSPQTKIYRGFVLMRMGIFLGAIQDLEAVITSDKGPISWAHHLKAKALAGIGKFREAYDEFESAIRTDKSGNKEFPKLRDWYKKAAEITSVKDTRVEDLISEAESAFKAKEYWYVSWVLRKVQKDSTVSNEVYKQALLLDLENMFALFQFRPGLTKAELLKEQFSEDQRFLNIYNKFKNIVVKKDPGIDFKTHAPEPEAQSAPSIAPTRVESKKEEKVEKDKTVITLRKRTEFVRMDDTEVLALYAKTFDLANDTPESRPYMLQFNEEATAFIGVEVIISNPFYNLKDSQLSGKVVWFMNDKEVGQNSFQLNIDRMWRTLIFVESWGSQNVGFWKRSQGRVDVYLHDQKVCERWFLVGSSYIENFEDFDLAELEERLLSERALKKQTKKTDAQPMAPVQHEVKKTKADSEKTLEDFLADLDSFTGLASVKQSMRDFVSYLEFIKERKKLGLKTQEGISIHSVFLGNPGTGKTTIARILGNIFRTMGLLEKGQVIEVDRSALVGQYVGETAQKTDAVIESAMGGLLFIDEAYTLVKKGQANDFGQEAIDTLLKKMEDKGSEFAVIVAGYPDNMNDFLESNPGMKSRFAHFFNFEDYTPKEMIEIFKMMAGKEDYNIEQSAVDLLFKEFTILYRKRDKAFGNARLVRNFFNDTKMALSKRYLKLPESERNQKNLSTIKEDDIKEVFKTGQQKSYKIGIDDEALKRNLDKLNGLTGLGSVKKDINEIVKLARYYLEVGQEIQNKFSEHILFLGNPGTGKTTVARIVSQIFAALGILPKGHLVEADRQTLVASFVGKTAEKTTEIINSSMGGTLFIDEAYALVKSGDAGGSDFGKEAIDTLLKRMEDDRGKFKVIAAGYTDDMKRFLESNVGLQSRFTKTITFEDYTPEELMTIMTNSLAEKTLFLNEEAAEKLRQHFNDIYRVRDKSFGNARLVRNLVEGVVRNQLLRLVDVPKDKRTPEMSRTITFEDMKELITTKKEVQEVKVEGNKELLDEYLVELNGMIGLASVKSSVEKLISGLKVAKLREDRGLKVIRKNLHAVFLGNPGTGKTTIARLISKVYKEMGLLQKGHLVEVDRSSLVAGYQGQTATKTDEVIQKSLGGTLFIDEAYTLARGANDFGQEAIDTLLKRMEDYRDSLVVIVAGYPNEMKTFLDANPGMLSRFTNFFNFEDYYPREMLEIASGIAEKSGYMMDEGALQSLYEIFNHIYDNRDKNFGNARTVRNMLYKAISHQEERILTLSSPSDNDLITITYEDVAAVDLSNDY